MKTNKIDYDENFHKGMVELFKQKRWTKLRLKHLYKTVNPQKGEKSIDIGCSSGATAYECSLSGSKVAGIL
jgi:precorrin-6B methylase 2